MTRLSRLSMSARFPAKLTMTHRPLRDGRDATVQKMRDFRSTLTANISAFIPASNSRFEPSKTSFISEHFVYILLNFTNNVNKTDQSV